MDPDRQQLVLTSVIVLYAPTLVAVAIASLLEDPVGRPVALITAKVKSLRPEMSFATMLTNGLWAPPHCLERTTFEIPTSKYKDFADQLAILKSIAERFKSL